jgi:hypothetical protein
VTIQAQRPFAILRRILLISSTIPSFTRGIEAPGNPFLAGAVKRPSPLCYLRLTITYHRAEFESIEHFSKTEVLGKFQLP